MLKNQKSKSIDPMSALRRKKPRLPNVTNKVVSVSIAGDDDGRCLEHPRWETQGGRLFLLGTVPHGASTNDWCAGLPSAVAWDQVTDYLVFESPERYLERSAVYEAKKTNR
jgi:hypothetical protein